MRAISSPPHRTASWLVLCAAGLVLLTGCGSSEGSSPPLATVITGTPSRPTLTIPPTTTIPSTTQPTTAAPTTTTTTPPSTTTAPKPPQAKTSDYLSDQAGFYFFMSPTEKFECGIFVTNTSVAGCIGDFPADAPKVPGSGSPNSLVPPNTIEITAGSPARFFNSGDPKYHQYDATSRVLPYGTMLTIPGSGSTNGLSCQIEEKTGVTCRDQVGHGFTVSSSGYGLE